MLVASLDEQLRRSILRINLQTFLVTQVSRKLYVSMNAYLKEFQREFVIMLVKSDDTFVVRGKNALFKYFDLLSA